MKSPRVPESQLVPILKEAITAILLFMVAMLVLLIFLTGIDLIGGML